MSNRDRLFDIADRQQGYFTREQAIACGYRDPNFAYYVSSGEWTKEYRGIYRLTRYPMTQSPDLVTWSLWSRGRSESTQGVISHDTALTIYGLSDINPAKIHMTVPTKFRRRSPIPEILVLHRADLSQKDYHEQQGYWMTTPLRTLLDIAAEGRLAEDLITQAVREAISQGMVLRTALENIDSTEAKRLMRLLDGPKIR
ncbi:MAG: type IV toxin-antitoxin system AbiEi family antitoxin domain-containing protein [Chlamydiia bacterium]